MSKNEAVAFMSNVFLAAEQETLAHLLRKVVSAAKKKMAAEVTPAIILP
jgi:hypothetical protein